MAPDHLKKYNENVDEINVSAVLKIIKARWYYFAVSFICVGLFGAMYIKFSPSVYEGSGSVLIKSSGSDSKDITDLLSGDLLGSEATVATEIGILNSNTVLKKTIDQLGLQVSYYNINTFPDQALYKKSPFTVKVDSLQKFIYATPFSLTVLDDSHFQLNIECDAGKDQVNYNQKHSFGEIISAPAFRMKIERNKEVTAEANSSFEFIVNSYERLISSLTDNLKISPLDKDADIITIAYRDDVPERALDLINTMCKVYIDLDVQDKASVASLTLHFVNEQLDTIGNTLNSFSQSLQNFKEKNGIVSLTDESKAILDRLSSADADRAKNKIDIRSLDNLTSYVTKNADLTQLAPSSLGIADPVLLEIIQNYQALQSKRKSLGYGVKNDLPALKIIDQQIDITRSTLIENIKSIRSTLGVTEKALEEEIGGIESKLKNVPGIEKDLMNIQRQFEVNQNIYIYLLQKKAESAIAKATAVSDNKVLDIASLSPDPVSPNKKLVVILSFLIAVIIPSIILLIQRIIKTTVANREDIARLTRIPVIGVIGHMKSPDNLIVSKSPKSSIAEAFRSIRTNLQFFGKKDENKIILITSSVGGEGKSFATISLASVFALQGNRVLIIGFDLRKPKIFQDFNIHNDIGISSYLIGKATLEQIIKPSGTKNLDFISAGPIPPNPAELISTKEVEVMLNDLNNKYDYIIIDTPPVGIVSDALILMNFSHINVYIIRENYSRKEYIDSLNELVKEREIKNISILLNDSNFGRSYGYSYGHNYGHRSGGYGYYEVEN